MPPRTTAQCTQDYNRFLRIGQAITNNRSFATLSPADQQKFIDTQILREYGAKANTVLIRAQIAEYSDDLQRMQIGELAADAAKKVNGNNKLTPLTNAAEDRNRLAHPRSYGTQTPSADMDANIANAADAAQQYYRDPTTQMTTEARQAFKDFAKVAYNQHHADPSHLTATDFIDAAKQSAVLYRDDPAAKENDELYLRGNKYIHEETALGEVPITEPGRAKPTTPRLPKPERLERGEPMLPSIDTPGLNPQLYQAAATDEWKAIKNMPQDTAEQIGTAWQKMEALRSKIQQRQTEGSVPSNATLALKNYTDSEIPKWYKSAAEKMLDTIRAMPHTTAADIATLKDTANKFSTQLMDTAFDPHVPEETRTALENMLEQQINWERDTLKLTSQPSGADFAAAAEQLGEDNTGTGKNYKPTALQLARSGENLDKIENGYLKTADPQTVERARAIRTRALELVTMRELRMQTGNRLAQNNTPDGIDPSMLPEDGAAPTGRAGQGAQPSVVAPTERDPNYDPLDNGAKRRTAPLPQNRPSPDNRRPDPTSKEAPKSPVEEQKPPTETPVEAPEFGASEGPKSTLAISEEIRNLLKNIFSGNPAPVDQNHISPAPDTPSYTVTRSDDRTPGHTQS